MPITIDHPVLCPAPTDVTGQLGFIDANGTAVDGDANSAVEVRVKVYGTPPNELPPAPVEPNTVATIQGLQWHANQVPDASSSSIEPYPENGFVAWARFSPNGEWEAAYRVFCGKFLGD